MRVCVRVHVPAQGKDFACNFIPANVTSPMYHKTLLSISSSLFYAQNARVPNVFSLNLTNDRVDDQFFLLLFISARAFLSLSLLLFRFGIRQSARPICRWRHRAVNCCVVTSNFSPFFFLIYSLAYPKLHSKNEEIGKYVTAARSYRSNGARFLLVQIMIRVYLSCFFFSSIIHSIKR